jgi:hypothetical protein
VEIPQPNISMCQDVGCNLTTNGLVVQHVRCSKTRWSLYNKSIDGVVQQVVQLVRVVEFGSMSPSVTVISATVTPVDTNCTNKFVTVGNFLK